ncbi:MAG: FAD-binding oxidoreductase, partial [Novosphingobium sp.]|nr:FAD-binding oxidoreductase [Novosphingobium sp.]
MSERFDFAIVGAGIAGASLAAGLAPHGRVLLLEAEDRPGYHSTGRSAAFWTESYGGPQVQPLTTASGPFLHQHGLLTPRGALTLARPSELPDLAAFVSEFRALGVRVDDLDRAALELRLPGLKPEWVAGAFEPDCCDIDVAGLHQLWLAAARQGGAELWTRARLEQASRTGGAWRLSLADGRTAAATVLVNAAGAWADPVAQLAGVRPLGIQPYRRTVAQLRLQDGPPADLPLVLGIDGLFYFKPEAGRLWLSPHDETPSPPCDAAPEELDVAL